MAENRNRTARSFLRTGNGPTAAAPADTESFVLPPRSSATHRESLRNSALSSTLVPVSSPALLPPPSVPASPVPSAIARSGCSSPTSVGHALIRCQRALLHLRCALPCIAIRSRPVRISTSSIISRTHTSWPAYCQGTEYRLPCQSTYASRATLRSSPSTTDTAAA